MISVPPIKRKIKRATYKKCFVAGVKYHNIDEVWNNLYEGEDIVLIREKYNIHDENAIAVALTKDYNRDAHNFDFDSILGYVPRSENKQIAQIMDMGWGNMFECEIGNLNELSAYNERIEIAIYIKNIKEETCKLRALLLNDEDYENLCLDLYEKGTTYFRWEGFPLMEHHLPKQGEKVLFIHKKGNQFALFLMFMIASGEKAYPYVDNEYKTATIDDCCCYVFTNIKGPLLFNKEDLDFLMKEPIDEVRPETFLPQEISNKIIHLLATFE